MTANFNPNKNLILFFDLDNTLYSPEAGLLQLVDQNICQFLIEDCQIDPTNLPSTRRRFAERYSSTLQGVMKEHGCNAQSYLESIHAVPDHALPRDTGALRFLLTELPHTKFILTNSYKPYAIRVLRSLGIQDLFADIFDVCSMGLRYKNEESSYRIILTTVGVEPKNAVMIDDVAAFLKPPQNLGMQTVHVTREPCSEKCTAHIDSIMDIGEILTK